MIFKLNIGTYLIHVKIVVHITSSLNLFSKVVTDYTLPFNRAAQIELLHALAAISNEHNLGQGILVKIKFNIIASLYDYNPNLAAFMKVIWKMIMKSPAILWALQL